ncbi:uncharacterized protein LACBIDRAFT_298002 [Laccaria bicolor S238N-H82]|uniref:Predicted protein n=1 Tax=Laccaria bicolor (strain S238N-H82 / ATCC MYA-4686) TaxID=486041 RepID=B0DC15_LACBS|nr:uncharacterized protein LACBIDRAFT_298002 [Laccaria bicolor S238N-H82]EDR07816.1 predicted protein [Laccaria bicolor S238N-H82]|eukprot:XP_001881605.1 predicted protein [Laccaria bicolor S238N-H82]
MREDPRSRRSARLGTLFPHVTASLHTHRLCLAQRAPDLPSYALTSNRARSITYQCGAPSGIKRTTNDAAHQTNDTAHNTNDVAPFLAFYGCRRHRLWSSDFVWVF